MSRSPNPDPVLLARSRIANSVRSGKPAEAEQARRELRIAKIERAIRQAVDAAPPLPDDQRARLAALLVPPRQPRQLVQEQLLKGGGSR